MSDETIQESLESLGNALARFGAALEHPDPDEIVMDGTIQRFEFSFELFWKTLPRFLQKEGVDTASPRSTLRHAYRRGLLDRERLWLDMLEDRNRSSHIYDAEMARAIYAKLPAYYVELRGRLEELKHRQEED
jgi:nucleotidyltransferase substrate binding protein (TIGR01987 family)